MTRTWSILSRALRQNTEQAVQTATAYSVEDRAERVVTTRVMQAAGSVDREMALAVLSIVGGRHGKYFR